MLYGPKDKVLQFVFEATNAQFLGGGCDGRRVANVKLGKLKIPEDAVGDVTVVAGWALGYSNVKITPAFTLVGGTHIETEGNRKPTLSALPLTEPATDTVKSEGKISISQEQSLKEAGNAVAASEPVKLNLRGRNPASASADTPVAASDPASDSSRIQEPVKLRVGEPKVPQTQNTPSSIKEINPAKPLDKEDKRQDSTPALLLNEKAAQPVQLPEHKEVNKIPSKTTVMEKTSVTPVVHIDPPSSLSSSSSSAPAPVSTGKIHIEDIEKLNSVAEVDAAINNMQSMIKEMKQKRAEKLKIQQGSASENTLSSSSAAAAAAAVGGGAGGSSDGKKQNMHAAESVGEGLSKEALKSLLSIERPDRDIKSSEEAEEVEEEEEEEKNAGGSASSKRKNKRKDNRKDKRKDKRKEQAKGTKNSEESEESEEDDPAKWEDGEQRLVTAKDARARRAGRGHGKHKRGAPLSEYVV